MQAPRQAAGIHRRVALEERKGKQKMKTWEDFDEAFQDAKTILAHADRLADNMAHILKGRLRKVSGSTLESLKKELRAFHCQTHKWRD